MVSSTIPSSQLCWLFIIANKANIISLASQYSIVSIKKPNLVFWLDLTNVFHTYYPKEIEAMPIANESITDYRLTGVSLIRSVTQDYDPVMSIPLWA
jgi:hypothetical protein